MRRREFITLLGGATVWPLPLRAQQPRPVIGFLGTGAQGVSVKWVAAFEEQLREHGWIDGRTIKIIYRWAEGGPERFAEIATEFVNSNVDVIVTGGNAVSAVRQATSIIPILLLTQSGHRRASTKPPPVSPFDLVRCPVRSLGGRQ